MTSFRSCVLAAAGAVALLAAVPSFADATTDSRAGPINQGGTLKPVATAAVNAVLTESFEGTFPPAGWIVRNQSATIGTNTNCWNPFTTTPWAPHSGSGHAGANFNCTTGANNISGWLISSQLTNISNGDQVSFWTRKGAPDTFADRLELRLCTDTTPDSCGAAGSTGSGDAGVGSFTTVLVTVNPTLVTGVYPTTFTQFTATISGLPAPVNGRIAFRYFVTNGGPTGANSDIISIDDVEVAPPPLSYAATPGTLTYTGDVGVATATQNVNIAAPGTNGAAVTFSGCTFGGANSADFAFSPAQSFPINVAPGTNVNLAVAFTAGAVGARTASLTCTSSNATALGGSFPITLNGTGTAHNYAATPATLTFAGVVGVASATQNANIAADAGNSGPVTFSGCTISGANAGDFALSPAPAFPLNIAAGANVNLPVAFTASAVGARTATLSCTASSGTAVGGSFPITLNGTGTALNYAATPATLTFTGAVGVASATQNTNIAADAGNSGPVTFSGCTISGANAGDFALSPAPAFPLNIAAGANVNLPVAFTASAAGARTATLSCATANGTAVGGSFPITLNGTGTAAMLASSPASGTTLGAMAVAGSSATRVIGFSNTGSAPGTVTCSATAGFTVSPPSVTLAATNGTGSVTVSALSALATTLTGTLTCTRDDGGAAFSFPLNFVFDAVPINVPTLVESTLWVLLGLLLTLGMLALTRRQRS